MRIELHFPTVLERATDKWVPVYPVAQFQDGGFVRGEVHERMPFQNGQHVQIVSQTPIHFVSTHLGGEVRRINQKHHTLENIKSLDPLLYSHLTHQKYIRIK